MEFSGAKVNITREMLGKSCIIPEDDFQMEKIKKIPFGELQIIEIKKIEDSKKRSYAQLSLFEKGSDLIAKETSFADDPNWNTKEKVNEQIKIKCKFYECYFYYKNEKTGVEQLNIKTRSISYANLKHLDACSFFDDAFKIQADLVGLDKDDWVDYVKSTCSDPFCCTACGVVSKLQKHHKFKNSILNKKLYGKNNGVDGIDYLNDVDNIQYTCPACNVSHAGQAKNEDNAGMIFWTEQEFCNHFNIEIRSKISDRIKEKFGDRIK